MSCNFSPRGLARTAFLFGAAIIMSCSGRGHSISVADGDTVYYPVYARGFHIQSWAEKSSVLTIVNPWQNAEGVAMQVFLSRGGEQPPAGFDGAVLDVPVRKAVVMSSSYVAYMDAIGEVDAVCAVSGGKYIMNESVARRFRAGEIREIGYDANVNYELIASLAPDVVMIYGIAGSNSALTRKFDELGVKYIYIGDHVEQSPLGKAEWVVAFGELFDKREEAQEIFTGIANRYESLREKVAGTANSRPTVMLNAPWRDTWFVPGDRSYMVRLIGDAGGDYACAGVDSGETRPISTESAFVYAGRSDVWLNPGQVETMAELKSQNPRFTAIPSVKSGRVYNATLRSTPEGGSDFWESGAVRPDVVLEDLVRIFHPDMLPDHEPYYFRKIE